jgi:uncharacterized membrane protein
MEAPEMPVVPDVDTPKKKTNVWLIVIIVLVVLCCCCLVASVIGYNSFKEPIMEMLNSFSSQVY